MTIKNHGGRSLAERRRHQRSGQGMIEYGLILGLIAVWVIAIFIALKPIFTEKFAAENIERYAGEGRAELAANLGVSFSSSAVIVDDGGGMPGASE